MPAAVERCKYYATCMTTVTFAVTVGILIPWYGHPDFPAAKQRSFPSPALSDPGCGEPAFPNEDQKKDSALAMIPTVIYGIVLYTLNYFRMTDGPYPFLRVHEQPWYMSVVWFVALAAAAYGIATGLRRLCGRKREREV